MLGLLRKTLAFSMTLSVAVLSIIVFGMLTSGEARALDKVDPYICPTQAQGTAIDCFLEAIPQTYTMCRHIKGIEIIEFGMAGSQEGVNGAKTDGCIDKHKLSLNLPYHSSLRAARNQAEVESLRKLYATWLDSMVKLHPAPNESETEYKARVVLPYDEFSAQTKTIHALMDAPPPATAKHPPRKKAVPKS